MYQAEPGCLCTKQAVSHTSKAPWTCLSSQQVWYGYLKSHLDNYHLRIVLEFAPQQRIGTQTHGWTGGRQRKQKKKKKRIKNNSNNKNKNKTQNTSAHTHSLHHTPYTCHLRVAKDVTVRTLKSAASPGEALMRVTQTSVVPTDSNTVLAPSIRMVARHT